MKVTILISFFTSLVTVAYAWVSMSAVQGNNTPLKVKVANALISSLFNVKPLYNMARSKARKSMVERGLQIDVDWSKEVTHLESSMELLKKHYEYLDRSSVIYPDYYKKPFHAYEEGNLCWQAAFEFEPAALTVHASIFTPDMKGLDREGDNILRSNFHRAMLTMLSERNFYPKRVLDIGCAGGLSTIKLSESFPEAEIIGIDLSPYMLSVAKFQLDTKLTLVSAKKSITYLHAAGENTTLGPGDVDLVTVCLVSHELPSAAAKAIFDECYRILPAGGAFAIMDMDPDSESFQKIASNPFAFTAFKSTEPWIQEYISMDLRKTLESSGFTNIKVKSNSPRHRTVVGFKS